MLESFRRLRVCGLRRLECQVRAYPLPAITWHVNGVELTPSARFVQTVVGEQVVLEIRQVTRDDAGIYTCRARSAVGEASTSTALIVSGTPPLHLSAGASPGQNMLGGQTWRAPSASL